MSLMKGEICYMLEYDKDKENMERNVKLFGDQFIKDHPNLYYLYENKSYPISASLSFLEVYKGKKNYNN